jgi:hypothetical protein
MKEKIHDRALLDKGGDGSPSVVCVYCVQIHGPPLPLTVNPNSRFNVLYYNFNLSTPYLPRVE